VHRWLSRKADLLLGCAHHHIIFTVPHELNVLWLLNYEALGRLLFSCARDSIFELCCSSSYMGAVPGVLIALHTWGQQLVIHPHAHCLVTAGGVDGAGKWAPARRRSLLPAEPLKILFRAKFIAGLRHLARSGALRFPDDVDLRRIERLCRDLWHKRWNLQIRERYEDPTAVLNYLGRYLQGGPISERRLLSFDGTHVTFRYKDYRDEARQKPVRLSCGEFVKRLLHHVPPKGFHRMRAYGIYRRGNGDRALREQLRAQLPIAPRIHDALTSTPIQFANPTPHASSARETCSICAAPIVVQAFARGSPELAMAA
jgi:hypothetical protein